MLAIVVSSILLALESPLNDPEGTLSQVLLVFDYITTTIFIFEAVIKIGALGFMFNGKESYMKNSWNIMDFIIVVISLVSLIPM
jgi:voltage-dependent calcium channel L type alpha-1D